jgi:hypothetical protein
VPSVKWEFVAQQLLRRLVDLWVVARNGGEHHIEQPNPSRLARCNTPHAAGALHTKRVVGVESRQHTRRAHAGMIAIERLAPHPASGDDSDPPTAPTHKLTRHDRSTVIGHSAIDGSHCDTPHPSHRVDASESLPHTGHSHKHPTQRAQRADHQHHERELVRHRQRPHLIGDRSGLIGAPLRRQHCRAERAQHRHPVGTPTQPRCDCRNEHPKRRYTPHGVCAPQSTAWHQQTDRGVLTTMTKKPGQTEDEYEGFHRRGPLPAVDNAPCRNRPVSAVHGSATPAADW